MGNGKFQLEYLGNPPEKVRLMFDAVTELIAQRMDITALTVADITARAGIGKGTAYEYFSSKEELITMALIYEYAQKITELKNLVDARQCFQDKMYGILDWLHDNSSYHMTFIRMLQISTGGRNVCMDWRSHIPQELSGQLHDYLCENGDAIMELGYAEGLFRETDVMKRRMAMASMIFQFAMTLGEKNENSIFIMDYEILRPYAYETLVRTLN